MNRRWCAGATGSGPLAHRGVLFLDELAEIIDTLTMRPEERRKVVRLLGEIDAGRG